MVNEDIPIEERGKTWVCLECGKQYKYRGALETHVQKLHPELWNVPRDMSDIEPQPTQPEPRPKITVDELLAEEEVPNTLQKRYPFAEKWEGLDKVDRLKLESAVEKIRPLAGLGEVINFRISENAITIVLARGSKHIINLE